MQSLRLCGVNFNLVGIDTEQMVYSNAKTAYDFSQHGKFEAVVSSPIFMLTIMFKNVGFKKVFDKAVMICNTMENHTTTLFDEHISGMDEVEMLALSKMCKYTRGNF
jgi:hypothetical protein